MPVSTLAAILKVGGARCRSPGFVAPHLLLGVRTSVLWVLLLEFSSHSGGPGVEQGNISQSDSVGGIVEPSTNTVTIPKYFFLIFRYLYDSISFSDFIVTYKVCSYTPYICTKASQLSTPPPDSGKITCLLCLKVFKRHKLSQKLFHYCYYTYYCSCRCSEVQPFELCSCLIQYKSGSCFRGRLVVPLRINQCFIMFY